MPSVYEAQCLSCGCKGHRSTAGYAAVFLDEPVEGESPATDAKNRQSRSNLKDSLREPEDHRLLVLAHPGGRRILEEAGYTWDTVKKAGRFVITREGVCECGKIFKVRKFTGPSALGSLGACLTLALCLVASIAVGFWLEWVCITMGAILALMLGCAIADGAYGRWYIRRHFRERASAIDGPSQCPNCGSKNFVSIASSRKFPCPQCGQTTMRFVCVGKS